MIRSIIICCLINLYSSLLTGQSIGDLNYFDYSHNVERIKYKDVFKKSTNELDFIFSFAYWFYKYFISSQDMPSCTFVPSCSTFGSECIKRHGVIKGMLLTFDRLTRCHPYNRSFYAIDKQKFKLIDPVVNY